jgi:hypothetical protein
MKTLFDFTLAFVTVVGSSIAEQTKTVRVSTAGAAGFNPEGELLLDDGDGELANDQDVYGQLGMMARPLDPETLDGRDYRAEVVAARTADGLVPLAWRDLRFERFFPNGIPKGTVRMVGYKGGFASFDVDAAGTANNYTIYLPYNFVNGVPQNAHAIVVDSDPANGITMTHGDGYQVALTSDGILMRTSDDATFFHMKEGRIVLTAAKIFAKGTLYVGQAGETGVPLLPGAASPPCPSLFLSPT